MADSALLIQIGGNHYKDFQMQPITLIIKAKCDFIQGCIIKYISRYKLKNGEEDVKKCIHYAELAIELYPSDIKVIPNNNIGLGYSYGKANGISGDALDVIISTLEMDYSTVIYKCKRILKKEYNG